MAVIYRLLDPRTHATRYIGQTSNPMRRYISHYSGNGQRRQVERWVIELRALHLKPYLDILQHVSRAGMWLTYDPTALRLEREWIDYYRRRGAPLLNS